MGSPLVTRRVSNLLVVHLFLTLTGQCISACNCIYQLRGSDITGLSVNKLLANHRSAFRKLGDFLVENRTCSTWTIKSDDFSDRQIWPIFALTDDRFLLADFIGRRNWPTLSFVWRPLYLTLPYLRGGQVVTPAQRWGRISWAQCATPM